MSSKAADFIKSLSEERPDLSVELVELHELYSARLWHQITLKLEVLVDHSGFKAGDALTRLYTCFVSEFGSKLNQLRLARFAVKASERFPDFKDRISFLEGVLDKLKQEAFSTTRLTVSAEPCLYIEMFIAHGKLLTGDTEFCKKAILEAKETLEQLTNIDPIVSAMVYFVSCQYHKSLKHYGDFYKDALLYLAFSSAETIDPQVKLDLAVDISLAALLADDVYNFGELLLHPILAIPETSPHRWLQEILGVFNRGDMTRFEEMCVQHAEDIKKYPELVEKFDHVRQKITIMCLLDLIFHLPPDERRIPLAVIGEQTKLDIDGVEFLLMRAFSLHLIEGTIDQVASYVQITWLHPRVLTMPELNGLYSQLSSWISKVSAVNLEIEQENFGVVEA